VGGRQHAPQFVLPLCIPHHRKVTAALFHARIDMTFTPDRHERLRRVLRAVMVFVWQLLDEDETNATRSVRSNSYGRKAEGLTENK
jgi:hypothetical protein